MINYEPIPGEGIKQTARKIVDLAKTHKEGVVTRFNTVELMVNPFEDPVTAVRGIVKYYDSEMSRQQTDYTKTTEGKLEEEEFKERKQQTDEAIKVLNLLDFSSFEAVIDWLEKICTKVDESERIIETFNKHGYYAGDCCEENFNDKDKESYARYIIGNALDGLEKDAVINNNLFCHFTKLWRERFCNK